MFAAGKPAANIFTVLHSTMWRGKVGRNLESQFEIAGE
jgi:hypothetical protein